MSSVQAWFSIDEGTNWNSLTLSNPWTNYYECQLPGMSDVYVSLKATATNALGNTETQTTIRGFYVRAAQPGLSGLQGFDSLGSGSILMVIGDISVNQHGTKPPGVNFQIGRDMTPLGYFSGMLGEDQLTVFDTNPTWIDMTTGRPLMASGVNLIAAIGGPGINAVSHYYETTADTVDRAPITFSMNATHYIWTDWNGSEVLAVLRSSCSDPLGSSDVLVMQVLRDADDRLVVLFYGTHYYGTWAAGWYFKFVVYPTITDWQDSYYIVRWTDAASGSSANFTPDQGDTYTILAQGSPP